MSLRPANVFEFSTTKPEIMEGFVNVPKHIEIIGSTRQGYIYTIMLSSNLFGNRSGTTYSLWSIILQYAEDYTHLLIRKQMVKLTKFAWVMQKSHITYWMIGGNNEEDGPWAPFNALTTSTMLWNMFDEQQDFIHTHREHGGFQIMQTDELQNLQVLKNLITYDKCRQWTIAPNYVIAEGTKKYEIRLPTFWVWFSRIVGAYEDAYLN